MITETYWDKEGNEIASPRTDHYRQSTIGCDIEAKKKAFDDALRLAQEVSNGECEGETSENLFKAYREYGACLVAGKEKNEIMQSMYYLESACGENL